MLSFTKRSRLRRIKIGENMALLNEHAGIKSNKKLSDKLFLLKLESPRLAGVLKPGQFVHAKIPGMPDKILRRPFSVYSYDSTLGEIEILYQVVGGGTERLCTVAAGEIVECIGPIGNGWTAPEACKRALIIGGGVGAAPVYELTRSLVQGGSKVDVVLGAQSESMLVCRDRYSELSPMSLKCSTDDGSFGHHGFCTDLVKENLEDCKRDTNLKYDYVACCGPVPLMRAVWDIAKAYDVPVQVSLEKRMACGIGACLSCVVDTKYKKRRVCVQGPVFSPEVLQW